MQATHSSKAPGFQPLIAHKVKNRFPSLCFQIQLVYCYNKERFHTRRMALVEELVEICPGGALQVESS
jgi:hypothetical protein